MTPMAYLDEVPLVGCGHCKKLAPVYEQLGQTYKSEPSCVVARVDADGNRDVASR